MPVVLVWNKRGGTIGERDVKHSLIPPTTSKTQPTTRREIVTAECPVDEVSLTRYKFCTIRISQLVSLSLNPMSKQTTPDTMKIRPRKSNSWRCCFNVFPWWGFRFKKKKSMAAAMPPVGLVGESTDESRNSQSDSQIAQIDEKAPKWRS